MSYYDQIQQGEALTLISDFIAQYKPVLCRANCPLCQDGIAHQPAPRMTFAEVVEVLHQAEETIEILEGELIRIREHAIESVYTLADSLQEELEHMQDQFEWLDDVDILEHRLIQPLLIADDENLDQASAIERIDTLRRFEERLFQREEDRRVLRIEFAGFLQGSEERLREVLGIWDMQRQDLETLREVSERAITAAKQVIDEDLEWYRGQRDQMLNNAL